MVRVSAFHHHLLLTLNQQLCGLLDVALHHCSSIKYIYTNATWKSDVASRLKHVQERITVLHVCVDNGKIHIGRKQPFTSKE